MDDEFSKIESDGLYLKKRKRFRFGRVVFLLLLAVLLVYGVGYYRTGAVVYEDDVVARVNGQDITAVELDAKYEALPDYYEAFFSKFQMLNQMIDDQLIVADVTEKGYSMSDAELEVALLEFKQELGMEDEQFAKNLEEQGITLETFMTALEQKEMAEKFFGEELFVDKDVSDEDAGLYYEANIEQFTTPEQVGVRHILVMVNESDEDALEKINSVKVKLDAGEGFAELAQVDSDCPSAANGGDLGFITADAVVPEFADVVFSMDVGEVSDVFKTEFGYHIAKLEAKIVEKVSEFEDVREDVDGLVLADREQAIFETYLEQLRANAEIEILLEE